MDVDRIGQEEGEREQGGSEGWRCVEYAPPGSHILFDLGSVVEQTPISLGIMKVGFGIVAVRVFVLRLVLHTYSEDARFSLRFRRRRQG